MGNLATPIDEEIGGSFSYKNPITRPAWTPARPVHHTTTSCNSMAAATGLHSIPWPPLPSVLVSDLFLPFLDVAASASARSIVAVNWHQGSAFNAALSHVTVADLFRALNQLHDHLLTHQIKLSSVEKDCLYKNLSDLYE